jgi:hypothetical protein
MAKPLSLVELARKTKPRKPPTWLDKLPADQQDALLKLKQEWQAEAFDLSFKQLYEEVVKPNVPGVLREKGFREWLNAK